MRDREPFGSTKTVDTVLVVDDDQHILALTGEMLRVAGYRVLKASVSSEAVLIFERNAEEIDLVLSDVQMPGLTGPELAGRLRQRSPDLPIVFMTGGAEDCAPPDALQKPFKMADLWSKVSDALNGALAITPTGQTREMKPQA
jgi:two-component system, cell cycle sensor histidine kinase and response regulator CckA